MMINKDDKAYKTIGKKNSNKSNQKFLMAIEDIIVKKISCYYKKLCFFLNTKV